MSARTKMSAETTIYRTYWNLMPVRVDRTSSNAKLWKSVGEREVFCVNSQCQRFSTNGSELGKYWVE